MSFIMSMFFLFCGVFFGAQTNTTNSIVVEIYSEPFDSKGMQSFIYLDTIKRKIKKLDLKFFPIVNKDQNGNFYSSRGDVELTEVARIEQIIERFPHKLNDYLIGRTLSSSYDGWKEACIYAQINPLDFDNYLNTNKKQLIKKAYERIQKKNLSDFSIFINSKKYDGDVLLVSFIENINKYLGEKEKLNLYQKEISMIKPPQFKIVYNDLTKDWVDEYLINGFKRFFPNIKPEMMKVDEIPQDKRNKIRMLPAYLIEKTPPVVDLFSNASDSMGFETIDDFYVYYNKNGNLLILDKQKTPKKLEAFVMSQCPFGVMSLNSLIDAIENGKIAKDISFDVHYIGDVFKDANGNLQFHSLHGDDEWKEDLRQILIKNKFPDKYFAYLKERNKNYSSPDWTQAAKNVGIDPEIIEKNFEEGKKLLEKDFSYTNSYGISSSPTFMIDGNIMVVGLGNLKKFDDYKNIDIKDSPSGGCGK